MAKPVVVLEFNVDSLSKQLTIIRQLCSQWGFALDTAILALDEMRTEPKP